VRKLENWIFCRIMYKYRKGMTTADDTEKGREDMGRHSGRFQEQLRNF
jgi:hypothetical protein